MLTSWLALPRTAGLRARQPAPSETFLQSDSSLVLSLAPTEALMEMISGRAAPRDDSTITETNTKQNYKAFVFYSRATFVSENIFCAKFLFLHCLFKYEQIIFLVILLYV